MDKSAYLNDLLNRYNANNSDPTIKDTERMVLDKLKAVEKTVMDLNNKLADTQAAIMKERGKTEALIDMLLTIGEVDG